MKLSSNIVNLNTLKFDENNSVRHDEKNIKAIEKSLQKFGQYRAFVVQKSTKKVIIGNGMLQAMLNLGYYEGEAKIYDIDDKEAALMGAMDNKTGELSEWDLGNLKDILSEQDPVEILDLGWENFELDALLGVENSQTPDFENLPDDDFDFEDEQEKEKNKKNKGSLKFDETQWARVRAAIVEIRKEYPEYDEAECVAHVCGMLLEVEEG